MSGLYVCPVPDCSQSELTLYGLRKHLNQDHPESRSRYASRMRRKSGTAYPHPCPDCRMEFIWKQELYVHMKLTHNFAYRCPVEECNQSYSKRCDLAIHLRYKHQLHSTQPSRKAHPCPHCHCGYSRSRDLQRHIERHHLKEVSWEEFYYQFDQHYSPELTANRPPAGPGSHVVQV